MLGASCLCQSQNEMAKILQTVKTPKDNLWHTNLHREGVSFVRYIKGRGPVSVSLQLRSLNWSKS